jgi:hypothetical protein
MTMNKQHVSKNVPYRKSYMTFRSFSSTMSRKFQVYMMIGMIAASITAFVALATVPVALADVLPGCSGNPHDVTAHPGGHMKEGPDLCPGAK